MRQSRDGKRRGGKAFPYQRNQLGARSQPVRSAPDKPKNISEKIVILRVKCARSTPFFFGIVMRPVKVIPNFEAH